MNVVVVNYEDFIDNMPLISPSSQQVISKFYYFDLVRLCHPTGVPNMARSKLQASVLVAYQMSTIGHCTVVRDINKQCVYVLINLYHSRYSNDLKKSVIILDRAVLIYIVEVILFQEHQSKKAHNKRGNPIGYHCILLIFPILQQSY